MASNSVSNKQLRQLLIDLGFRSAPSVQPKCSLFEHPESHSRLLLPANKDDEPARSADILSIRTHLAYRGHLDEAGFDTFLRQGRLRAS